MREDKEKTYDFFDLHGIIKRRERLYEYLR